MLVIFNGSCWSSAAVELVISKINVVKVTLCPVSEGNDNSFPFGRLPRAEPMIQFCMN